MTSTVELAPSFETETQAEFAVVQTAMRALLSALPGEILRPRDLQRVLGVHYKICWHIFQVANATDAMAAAKSAPSSAAMQRVLRAAEDLGVSPDVGKTVLAALERFGQVVARHSDDRNEFDSMAAAASKDEIVAATDLSHRKTVYRSMGHLWGIRLDIACGTLLVRLSESGEGTDECVVIMKKGLRRLRPEAAAVIHWQYYHTAAGKSVPAKMQGLDEEAEKLHGVPILPEFCSKPLPKIHSVNRGPGLTQYELADRGLGRSSIADFTTARIARQVPFSRDENGRRLYRFSFRCTTATGLLVQNLLVHRPSFGRVTPKLMMFQSTQGDESPEVASGAAQLAVWEKVEQIEGAWRLPPIPEVPTFGASLKYAFEKLTWDIGEFELFRVRIPYPVFGSIVRLQFQIDE